MTTRIDPRLLGPFVAVAETLHFGHAAEQLLTDQSALSRQIARLEAQVGLQLFVRSSRHVELTEAGRAVLALGRDVLTTARRAADAARTRHSEQTVRVHSLSTESPVIQKMLSRFSQERPKVGLVVTDGGENDVATAVLAGTVDVGVVYDFAARAELGWEQFAALDYGVFCRSDHPLAGSDVARWADFDRQTVLVAPALLSDGYNRYLRRRWAAADVVVVERPAPANRASIVVDTLIAGNCLIVLPRDVLPRQPALAWTPLDPPWTVRYGVAWQRESTNPAVHELVRWLGQQSVVTSVPSKGAPEHRPW